MKAEDEAILIGSLSECYTLIRLISRDFPNQESYYFLRVFFIELRQLCYYLSGEKSPLVQYKKLLSPDEQKLIDEIINVRHASAHPESSLHWVSQNIRITGSTNFKNKDAEIQFGSTKISLLKTIDLFIKIRSILLSTPELAYSQKNPLYKMEEEGLKETKQYLSEKLTNPEELIKARFPVK